MPWNLLGKTRTVKCPGGREIRVYKNPRNAFPLYTEDWGTQFKGAVDAATQLTAEIGGEFANRMSRLLFLLDDTNGGMQLKLSASYQYYAEDPCTREQWFERQLTQILSEETRLKTASVELAALRLLAEKGADSHTLLDRVEQMMARLSRSDIEHDRQVAFENASSAVDEWQKGSSEDADER